MKGKDALFSHASDEWGTPQDLFDTLDAEFHFTLDPCATPENHKCPTYFTQEDNGLEKSWGGYRVFCNPPYSNVKEWVAKASHEADNGVLSVLLLPARTDTRWFHEYIYGTAEIRFIKGRLRFQGGKYNAPFPSMICVFNGVLEEKENE